VSTVRDVNSNRKIKKGGCILERKSDKQRKPSFVLEFFEEKIKMSISEKKIRDEHSGTERYTQRDVPEIFLTLWHVSASEDSYIQAYMKEGRNQCEC
jgi:hypothetical protein